MPTARPATGTLRLEGVAFGYGGRPVVAGVDLTVGPGDFVGVLGPNGAGKSTLFRGMLGLLRPLAGRVEREGVRPGYVPQRDALDVVFPLTVREVVALGAVQAQDRLGRLPHEMRARVEELLGEVGLTSKAGALFSSLSGGQRQRALLARALVPRPNLLLLDEPTSGVDAPTQERILALLRRLNREERLAILLVSHHLASTVAAVERVAWVADGTVRCLAGADAHDLSRLDALFGAGAGEAAR